MPIKLDRMVFGLFLTNNIIFKIWITRIKSFHAINNIAPHIKYIVALWVVIQLLLFGNHTNK